MGEVGGYAGEHVRQFAAQVGFQLDDGGAPHGVDASCIVEEVEFVFDFAVGGAETFPQQFGDMAAQGFVAGAASHGAHDGGQGVAAPIHGRMMRGRRGCG